MRMRPPFFISRYFHPRPVINQRTAKSYKAPWFGLISAGIPVFLRPLLLLSLFLAVLPRHHPHTPPVKAGEFSPFLAKMKFQGAQNNMIQFSSTNNPSDFSRILINEHNWLLINSTDFKKLTDIIQTHRCILNKAIKHASPPFLIIPTWKTAEPAKRSWNC